MDKKLKENSLTRNWRGKVLEEIQGEIGQTNGQTNFFLKKYIFDIIFIISSVKQKSQALYESYI